MFGSSYSEGALDKFSKVVSELNNSIERQLAEYPVDGIKLQSEMIVESFGDIFDKQKKIDQENRQIWTAGIWMYLLDYYYDGKPSHHDKFTKAAIRPLSPIGKNNLYLTSNNGKMIVVNLEFGKIIKEIKISGKLVSKPIIYNEKLFLIKNGSIIRYN